MEPHTSVIIGLDVGKTDHHACALNTAGEKLFDKPLPQDETQLRALFINLQQDGRGLMVVDQLNTIGALPVAVARDTGCEVAYLPGLAMRKAADLYPGRSKTDARDAFIIADTARTMPQTLRQVDRDSEVLSSPKVLAGFDEDLAHEMTRALNRIRSLLAVLLQSRFEKPERAKYGKHATGKSGSGLRVFEGFLHHRGITWTGIKKAGFPLISLQ